MERTGVSPRPVGGRPRWLTAVRDRVDARASVRPWWPGWGKSVSRLRRPAATAVVALAGAIGFAPAASAAPASLPPVQTTPIGGQELAGRGVIVNYPSGGG